jgi:xanthine permease
MALHPVDEVLPLPRMAVYGLQHVLSMYAGVVAVPLIVGTALRLDGGDITFLISASLLISGLATLLQTLGVWKIGVKLPIVQGTSFAAVATMLAIGTEPGGTEGLREIYGALIVAGAVAFLLAPYFSRVLHFFPPVVTGTVITVIGISLLPVAVRWAQGVADTPGFQSVKNILLAGATLLIIVLIYRFLPGFFSRIAILMGLLLGTLVAIPMDVADLSRIDDAAVFQLTTPFEFGAPIFGVAAIVSMFIVMLVIMTETTADILAIGEIVDKPQTEEDVAAGLRADMLSTSVAGALNGFSVSAFAQNVGLVGMTGIKSRYVVAVGGVILVALGLFPSSDRSPRSSRCRSSAAPGSRCSAPSPRAASAR